MADMETLELDHRRLDACSFVLLDPLCGGVDDRAAWADFPQHPLVPKGFEAQAEQLPRLVCLRDLDRALYERLMGMILGKRPAPGTPVCVALLQTRAATERMALRCRHLLAPRFGQGQRGVFRFYDPAVLEHLVWMLDERHLANLLGPVDAWALPLRGRWYVLPRAAIAHGSAPSFSLRAATWQRIRRIGALCAVLKHNPVWQAAPALWGPRAEALLIRAHGHQLSEREDAVAFACHGLRWHAHFDSHRRVRSLLADCKGHPARYARLAGRWKDSDWQAIQSDLDQMIQNHSNLASTKSSSQGAY